MTVEDLIKSIANVYSDCLRAALEDARKNVKNDSWDLGTLVKNATWSAYCEGLEEALRIVDECTTAGLKELAERKLKAEGLRSLQDRVETDGPDMNATYPKV